MKLKWLFQLIFGVFLIFIIFPDNVLAQQIIPDGRTNTNVEVNETITNITTETIINSNAFNSFNRFNIKKGNTVNLFLPENVSNLINLIHQEKTVIEGVLNSLKNNRTGGNIYLVNPYGITIGPEGSVNVGSLTAVTPANKFMNKVISPASEVNSSLIDMLLQGKAPVNEDSSIMSEGEIKAIESVRLYSKSITNTGKINTGTIFAEKDINTDDIVNTNSIETEIESHIKDGEIYLSASRDIVNSGEIVAASIKEETPGNITLIAGKSISLENNSLLHAEGSNSKIYAEGNIVSSKGLVDVSGSSGGRIVFIADEKITSSGSYIARGNNETGGCIDISAPAVELISAQIDASGEMGGGTIRIGGEFQGGKNLKNDEIPNAKVLTVNENTIIKADSNGSNGDGGKIINWSDDKTIALGSYSAKPGTNSGCGGFVEISSKNLLTFTGDVQTSAGERYGQVLLDPKDIIISAFGIADILNNDEYSEIPDQLALLSNAAIVTLLETPQNVILQANNDIIQADAITVNNVSGDGGNLTFQAGRSITLNANIFTDNGDLNIYANDLISNGVVDAQRDPGNAEITITPGFTLDAGTGNVNIEIRSDPAKTNNTSGNIILSDIIANTVTINNNGPTADSNIIMPMGTINASGTNNSLVISTMNGNFINTAGTSSLIANNGRWLVYSNDPIITDETGLTFSKMYGSTLTGDPPATIPVGDYILYSIAPILNVTAVNYSKTYGDLNTAFAASITGFIDGDTPAEAYSGLPDLTTIATQYSNAGSYQINAAGGTLNSTLGYLFNYIDATLTINPASLTIQANNATKVEGSVNPSFSANYTGFVLGETSSVLSGSLNLFTTADTSSPPGTYSIIPSGLLSTNYAINYLNGVLTIIPDVINPGDDPVVEETILNSLQETTGALTESTIVEAVAAAQEYARSEALVVSESVDSVDPNDNPDKVKTIALSETDDSILADIFGNDGEFADLDEDIKNLIIDNDEFLTDSDIVSSSEVLNDPEIQSMINEGTNILNDPEIAAIIDESTNILNDPEIATIIDESTNILNDSEIATIIDESTNILNDPDIQNTINESTNVLNDPEIQNTINESTNILNDPEIQSTIDESTNVLNDTEKETDNIISENDEYLSSTDLTTKSITRLSAKYGDEPIDTGNYKMIAEVFNMCQDPNSCKKIVTPENIAILDQVINTNVPKLEFAADISGTGYLARTNYHPAAIKAYLITINLIENIKKINRNMNPDLKPEYTSLSYLQRHPLPKDRIRLIDKFLNKNNRFENCLKIINRNRYRAFLNQPDGELQLSPKVNEFLTKLHKITDNKIYYNAYDYVNVSYEGK